MPFNIMKITIDKDVLFLNRKDGEALLELLDRSMLRRFTAPRVASENVDCKVELVRFSDLSEEEQAFYQKLQAKPLFKSLPIITAGPKDDRLEEPT